MNDSVAPSLFQCRPRLQEDLPAPGMKLCTHRCTAVKTPARALFGTRLNAFNWPPRGVLEVDLLRDLKAGGMNNLRSEIWGLSDNSSRISTSI